jgi:uncharacterized membrane protein YtjA (UPF0391 family)
VDLTAFIASIGPRFRSRFSEKFRHFRRGTQVPRTALSRHHRGAAARPASKEEIVMLSWVLTFLVIALIAGVLGFGGIAGASVEIAKIIFFIAIVLFLISAVFGFVRGRSRV